MEEEDDDPEISFNTSKTREVEKDEDSPFVSKRGRKRSYRESSNPEEVAKSIRTIGSSEKLSSPKPAGLLESIKKNFLSSNKLSQRKDNESTDEDDAICPFECGLCNQKFSTVETLEAHVTKEHDDNKSGKIENEESHSKTINKSREISGDVIDEVTDEFSDEVAAFEAAEEKMQKQIDAKRAKFEERKNANKVMMVTMVKKTGKVVVGGKRPSERNWQECPARNWAAEFGYGGVAPEVTYNISRDNLQKFDSKQGLTNAQPGAKEKEERGRKKGAPPPPVLQGNDLISKMRATFRKDDDDDAENDEVGKDDGDKMFRSRGLKGTIKASPGKAPRTLSSSSLRTRQRMEALMKRAREFMKQNKKDQMKVKKNKGKSTEDVAKKKSVNKTLANTIKKDLKAQSLKTPEKTSGKTDEQTDLQKETIPESNDLRIGVSSTAISSVKDNELIAEGKIDSTKSTSKVSTGLPTQSKNEKKGEAKQSPATNIIRKTRSQRKNEPGSNLQGRNEIEQDKHTKKNTARDPEEKSKGMKSKTTIDKSVKPTNSVVSGKKPATRVQMGLLERMQKNFEYMLNDETEKEQNGTEENIMAQNNDIIEQNIPTNSLGPNKDTADVIREDTQSKENESHDIPQNTLVRQEQQSHKDIESETAISTNNLENEEDNVEQDSDDDADSDIEMDGLLIPLENGWVCEKRLLGEEEREQRLQELEQQRRRRGRSAQDDEFAAMR